MNEVASIRSSSSCVQEDDEPKYSATVDNLCFQLDIHLMLRRALAFLLVLFWVVLSEFDVLEDLNLPGGIEIDSSTDVPLSGGQTGRLVNNSVESADNSRIRRFAVLDQRIIDVFVDTHTRFPKSFKLHKLHRVFLI